MDARLTLSPEDKKEIAVEIAEYLKPLLADLRAKDRDIFFDVVQLSQYLNVSRSCIYERIRGNEIPHSKLGKYLRFRKSDIDKWVESNSIKPFG